MVTRVERRERSASAYDPSPDEQPVEVGRYLSALRRNRLVIALIVVPITGIVLALSLLLPKTYTATARIVLRETPFELVDVETLRRELATTRALLTTHDVLAQAAIQLPGESAATLESKVSSSIDREANIIYVNASDSTAGGAAAAANAVATAFLARERALERQLLARARANLTAAARRSGGATGSAQTAAIRERLSELSVAEASAGSRFQLAQRAEPPAAASSPRPVRNTVFALFASLFLGILAAVGREQLTPRVSSGRELGRLTGLPVLAGIPYEQRRLRRRRSTLSAVEQDAYESLQATVRMRLEPGRQHVILVTSALVDEGKTEVTANLGRAFANAGEQTLLVCADLRRPRLHERFGLEPAPGFADILAAPQQTNGRRRKASPAPAATAVRAPGRATGRLDVIPGGTRQANPAQLLSGPTLESFFTALEELDYAYVLVDGPPLLGVVDAQLLARRIENLLVVARPERLTRETVLDLHEVLDGLDANPLGLVVMGDASAPYNAAYGVFDQPA